LIGCTCKKILHCQCTQIKSFFYYIRERSYNNINIQLKLKQDNKAKNHEEKKNQTTNNKKIPTKHPNRTKTPPQLNHEKLDPQREEEKKQPLGKKK
jgi:hypothetical protein